MPHSSVRYDEVSPDLHRVFGQTARDGEMCGRDHVRFHRQRADFKLGKEVYIYGNKELSLFLQQLQRELVTDKLP